MSPADGNGSVPKALIEARSITRRFGDLVANDHIDLLVRAGEIHALLGENGAGKSTLVKILYGALQPDEGALLWRGTETIVPDPAAARALGIGMVFQHFSLFEALTVLENIVLALPGHRGGKALADEIRAVSERYGLPIEPDARVANLSVGERQRIEIVRCLLQEPSLIILDEPTSVLTPQEANRLFDTLERLSADGCAILYISHRLEEVKRLCHAATILRGGRVVATCDPRMETAASLARMMIGESVESAARTDGNPGAERLVIDDLTADSSTPFGVALRHVSLTVRGGEIVAIAGVAGNGQSELFDYLSGEEKAVRAESIKFDGKAIGHLPINERRQFGAAFIPEERLGHSAVPTFPLSENAALSHHALGSILSAKLFLNRQNIIELRDKIVDGYDVRKGSGDVQASALSGGNLQKYVVGRELDRVPDLIIVNQPTWGVDAGAAALIRKALIDLARQGAAIVAISQDLDEIFEIADRVAVISRGELSDTHPIDAISLEEIGLLMAGKAERKGVAEAALADGEPLGH